MLRVNLSDNTLLTMVVPGGILGTALLLSFWPHIVPVADYVKGIASTIKLEWQLDLAIVSTVLIAVTVLLAYVVAVVLGAVIAVIVGYLEAHVLDRYQAQRLRITHDDYVTLWYRYLDHLDEARNSYVSKQVTSFMFEARSSVALVVLALCGFWSPLPAWGVTTALLLAVLLFVAALHDHGFLAEYRQRRFSSAGEFVYDAKQLVRCAIERWCSRQQLEPLRVVLPVWPRGEEKLSKGDEVLTALRQARDMASNLVWQAEQQMLDRALTVLQENSRS